MTKVITNEKQVDDLLTRGVEQVLPDKKLLKKELMSGRRLKIYQGFDPSAKNLHIGNAIGIKMLEKFRRLGHHVIFLMGTGTGKIGDPTDKLATRKVLTDEEVEENITSWKEQASQIMDFDNKDNPVEILKNGDWLNKMTLSGFLDLCNRVTVQQLLERDMFQERIEENKPISVSEVLYPILQGYDSVAMKVDIEFGGNDQLFNMMMGRTLLKSMLNKEKFVMTGKLLIDPSGVKMGKSIGNVINLTDEPKDIYGKVMAFSDDMIIRGFEILTEIPMSKVQEYDMNLKSQKGNPMTYKKELAFEVVKWIKGEAEAQKAQAHFEKTVQKQELPDEIKEKKVSKSKMRILELIVEVGFADSNSEAKQLIKGKGVKLEGKVIEDINKEIEIKGQVLQVGKRKVCKVVKG